MTKDDVITMFTAAANKFIKKVETHRAHSVETYAELKLCVEAANELQEKTEDDQEN